MQKRKLVLLWGAGGVALTLLVIVMLNSSSLPSATFNGHSGPTAALAFSPSGGLVASGTQMDGAIAVCRWPGGEPQQTLKGDSQGTVHIAFSPDGTLLATCSLGWTIDVWRLADGTRIASFNCKPAHPQMAAFSNNPDELITLEEQIKGLNASVVIRRWSIADGTSQLVLERSVRGGAREFILSHDQSRLYLGTASGVELWNLDNRDAPLDVKLSPRALASMAISKDGSLLTTTAGIPASTLSAWDIASETVNDFVKLNDEEYFGKLAFSPHDNSLLAVVMHRVGQSPSDVILFDVKMKQEIGRISPAGNNVLTIAFSPDGRWLAAAGDGPIKAWDLAKYSHRREPR